MQKEVSKKVRHLNKISVKSLSIDGVYRLSLFCCRRAHSITIITISAFIKSSKLHTIPLSYNRFRNCWKLCLNLVIWCAGIKEPFSL